MIDANIFRAYAPQVFTATQRLEAEAAQRMREAEMAQRNRLMELQISAAQDTARETAMQRAERVAAQERMRNALAMLPSPEMRASQNALAGGGGPTVANAAGMRPVDPRASMLYQLAQADQSYIPKYLETLDPNFGREQVTQFIETQGGRVGVNRFGDTTGKPIPFAPDVQMVNLGGRTVAVDRRAVAPGTAFDVTMTPSERDASVRGWASQRTADARLAFDRASAAAAATAEAGGPDQAALVARFGKPPADRRWRPDGTLEVIPGSKSDAEDRTAKQGAAAKAKMAFETIDKMLKHPGLDTAIGLSGQINPSNYVWGSDAKGAQALIEQAQGQAFLQAFESLKGGGQITQTEGEKATAAIARLQRSQSDSDFKAAAQELRDIANEVYKRQTGQSLMPSVGASGGWGIRPLGK